MIIINGRIIQFQNTPDTLGCKEKPGSNCNSCLTPGEDKYCRFCNVPKKIFPDE